MVLYAPNGAEIHGSIFIFSPSVTINNFTILGEVYIEKTKDIILKNNKIKSNARGIFINNCQQCILTQNEIYGCSKDGVYLFNSTNNTIIFNVIKNNSWCGISLDSSSNNIITNNEIFGNINGVRLINSDGNYIFNNVVHNNWCGISIYKSNQNIIENNVAFNNGKDGIYLERSCYNQIKNNHCYTNNGCGISLETSSYNVILQNIANNNGEDGIYLGNVYNCTQRNMRILYGVGHDNLISGNEIYSNSWNGIYVEFNFNTTLSANKVYNNTGDGVFLRDCENSLLINNEIYGNHRSELKFDNVSCIVYFMPGIYYLSVNSMSEIFLIGSSNFKNTEDVYLEAVLKMDVNDMEVNSTSTILAPYEEKALSVEYKLNKVGNYRINISYEKFLKEFVSPILNNLTVTPTSGVAPLTITATCNITNTGGTAGNYTATLYVNNNAVNQTTVTLNPGESKTVSLSYTLTQPGTYNVTIGNLTPVTVTVSQASIQNKTFTITLTNLGKSTITIKYYISIYTNPVNGTKVSYRELTITLKPNETKTIELGKYLFKYAVSGTMIVKNPSRYRIPLNLRIKYEIEGLNPQMREISKYIAPRGEFRYIARYTGKEEGYVGMW